MAELRFTILGCGSSGGVPRLGGHWGACDPTNPKNNRRRCSMLVERITEAGTTTVLIDTSPDLRSQLLDANVGRLDAVIYTHSHADHVHGIDDLRMIVFNMRARLPVWDMNTIDGDVTVTGAGGDITFTPFSVNHGAIDALGFRIADVAYLPDVASIPDASWEHLRDLDCWIVDALRRDPHPTHSHLAQTLEWIDQMQPKQAVLTNMHIDLDYQTLTDETPDHIQPAFDGLSLTFAD